MDRREPSLSFPSQRRPAPRVEPADDPPRLRSLRTPGQRPPRSLARRLLSVLLYAGLGVACLMLAVVTFLLVSPPTDLVRDHIVAEVKTRTGRTLVLEGPASFSVFPTAGVRVSGVSLSAPPGMQAAPLVTMKRLSVDLRLIPLLRREVVIDRMVLNDPVFELTVDPQGRRSWDFAEAALPAAPTRLAQAGGRGTRNDALPPELRDFVRNASDPEKAAQRARLALEDLVLADLRIDNGTLHYRDLRAGVTHDVRTINLEVGLRTVAAPMEARGQLVWRGEPLKVDARLTTLKALLEGRPARLAASVSSAGTEAGFDGSVTQRAAFELDGRISGKTSSVRTLAAWLGNPLPPSAGFGKASVEGTLKSAGITTSLEGATITLDGATATGNASLELAARPYVKANMRIAGLDLRTYATQGKAPDAVDPGLPPPQPSRAGGSATPARPAPAGPATSIEDLLERDAASGPRVRGFTQRAGWSSEPIGLPVLGAVDADAKIALAALTAGDLKIGTGLLTVALKSGVLRLDIDDAQLYEGRARGFVNVDVTRTPTIGGNLQLDGVEMSQLLQDAAGSDLIAGKGRIALALAGQGHSEKEIVETLAGRIDLTVADGAILGWNFPEMVRGLSQGRFPGFERTPGAKTELSELAGTWLVEGGIATSRDLRMASQQMRMTAAGTIELPARRLDYLFRPRLAELSGFEVPIRVQGPWDRPSYMPEVKTDQVMDVLKQVDPQGKVLDVVRRAIDAVQGGAKGGKGDAKGGKGNNDAGNSVDKLIEQLFGR